MFSKKEFQDEYLERHSYTSEKGKISLITFMSHTFPKEKVWEIHCKEGALFPDVITFKTKKEAMVRIWELLSQESQRFVQKTNKTSKGRK